MKTIILPAILLSILLFLAIGADRGAHAQTEGMFDDDVIRVLFVIDNQSQLISANRMISWMNATWNRYQWVPGKINLEVVRNNSPILKPAPRLSGSKDNLIKQLKEYVEKPHPNNPNLSIRDYWGADIVIGLAQDIPGLGAGFNGWAPMDHWVRRNLLHTAPREFVPISVQNFLDRRGAETFYLAVVDQDALPYAATHELGHLLGAGHYELKNWWLREDSHAYGFHRPGGKVVTAVGETVNDFCNPCGHIERFSDAQIGSSTRQNTNAIDTTAKSVANYRVGPGPGSGAPSTAKQCEDGIDNDGDGLVDMADPGCSGATDDNESNQPPPSPGPTGCNPAAYVPVNVRASILQVCIPGTSRSAYRVQWDHACTGGVYEVFGTTAGTGTYLVTSTGGKSVNLAILGPPSTSTVRVRACNSSFVCSALSLPPVVLTDLC